MEDFMWKAGGTLAEMRIIIEGGCPAVRRTAGTRNAGNGTVQSERPHMRTSGGLQAGVC